MREQTRAFRLELDHWSQFVRSYAQYERRVRPITSGLDGLRPVLTAIQDMWGPPYSRLTTTASRVKMLITDLRRIEPPADLLGVHSTLLSALFMARQATERRRQAVIAPNLTVAQEASAAASGAVMLLSQARADLLAQLVPPRFK